MLGEFVFKPFRTRTRRLVALLVVTADRFAALAGHLFGWAFAQIDAP